MSTPLEPDALYAVYDYNNNEVGILDMPNPTFYRYISRSGIVCYERCKIDDFPCQFFINLIKFTGEIYLIFKHSNGFEVRCLKIKLNTKGEPMTLEQELRLKNPTKKYSKKSAKKYSRTSIIDGFSLPEDNSFANRPMEICDFVEENEDQYYEDDDDDCDCGCGLPPICKPITSNYNLRPSINKNENIPVVANYSLRPRKNKINYKY